MNSGLDSFSRIVAHAITQAVDQAVEAPVEGKKVDDVVASVAANTWALRADELLARAHARLDGAEAPVPTPWGTVNDRMGGGLWPGMHVLVGGTGTGKSQWALQVAMGAARAGVPVLVLSLELDALGLFARAVSFVERERDPTSKLKWSTIYTGGRGEHHADASRARAAAALDTAVPTLRELPFHWVEAPPHGLPHTKIVELVAALRAAHPTRGAHEPVLVVVDFLQLVAGVDPREDSITRVSHAAYQCRQVARDHNAVVLVLSSTSRVNAQLTSVEDRAGDNPKAKEPAHNLVGLGKESGDVEYSADSVMVLCREAYADGSPPLEGGRAMWLAVAKVRAGGAGWHQLRFDGSRFIEAPRNEGQSFDDERAFCPACDELVRVELVRGRWQCREGHETDAPDAKKAAMPLTGKQLKAAKKDAQKDAEKAEKDAKKDAENAKKAKAVRDAESRGDELVQRARAQGDTLVLDAKKKAAKIMLDATPTTKAAKEAEGKELVLDAQAQAKAALDAATSEKKKLVREARAAT